MRKENFSWLGIDVAKNTFDAAIHPVWTPGVEPPLNSLPSRSFPRTGEGVELFLDWAGGHGISKGMAVMEATGRYSIELGRMLLEADRMICPSIVDAFKIKHFGKSLRVRNKTDKADAALIARYGAERNPQPWQPQSEEYVQLQELTRLRAFSVAQRVAAENRLREIREGTVAHKLAEKMLRDCRRGIEKIDGEISRHIGGHACLREAAALMMTIPGVGPVTAATVLSELGDITRFKRSRQLSAYAGLSPQTHVSGESVRLRTRLSKTGSARLRQILYLAALSIVRSDNALSAFYRNMLEKGKPEMVALGALMRKMLVLMRAILIHSKPYDDDFAYKAKKSKTMT